MFVLIYGLTNLGVVHTIISLVAVATGIIALVRDWKISWDNSVGKIYVVTTILTCLTGFGIFQHGGFGKPHVLGVITLTVLEVVYLASRKKLGKNSPYIELVGYTMTFLFHVIPGITETLTRLPLDAPLASSQEDPRIQMGIGIAFVLFLVVATLQVRKLKTQLQAGGKV